jgi:hypothetical protein
VKRNPFIQKDNKETYTNKVLPHIDVTNRVKTVQESYTQDEISEMMQDAFDAFLPDPPSKVTKNASLYGTALRECPSCERERYIADDDYICTECREAD